MGPSVWLVALKAGLACPSESQETNRKSSDEVLIDCKQGARATLHTRVCTCVAGNSPYLLSAACQKGRLIH